MSNGRWIVHYKGGPNQDCFEIAVVREDNGHGLKSYGWFDENKLLISHSGGPCSDSVTEFVWHELILVACAFAQGLNEGTISP